MTGFFRQTLALTGIEWRRRRFAVLAFLSVSLAGWGLAILYIPELWSGAWSREATALPSFLLAGILAIDAFARDFGAQRIEFLHSAGARPSAVFASRLIHTVGCYCMFVFVFGGLEWLRLELTPEDPVLRARAASTPRRELLYLYLLPAAAFLWFTSSVSSRWTQIAFTVLFFGFGIYYLDRSVLRSAEFPERALGAAALTSVILAFVFLLLSFAAVRLRRHDSARPNVPVLLLGCCVLFLGVRHVSIAASSRSLPIETESPVAVALAPGATRAAIETRSGWKPSPLLAFSARVLGDETLDQRGATFGHVFLLGMDGDLSLVSARAASLEHSKDSLPWFRGRFLRIRGFHPDAEAGEPAQSLLFDVLLRRVTDTPSSWGEDADAKNQQLCILPSPETQPLPLRVVYASVGTGREACTADGEDDLLLFRFSNNTSLHLREGRVLEWAAATGGRRVLNFAAAKLAR